MASFRFNSKVVTRAKNQNAVAKAAYNSAEKIKDYNEDEYKDFTKKSCDYSLILCQEHVPVEYYDREYLWNKVHETEKRKDSQLAREIQISLPNELSHESNIELAKEFAESLKDEGMIVDLNIHKLNSNNPHAHLLCTLRGIDENGNFEPKRIGNEFVRDWNTKQKNLEWRERWSDVQNKHLEKNGFMERVSHKSYEDQGIDLEPTKTEGWINRKYQKEKGELTSIAKYNLDVRKRNKEKIEKIYKNNNKDKLDPYDYINKEQAKKLSSISKELKVYISPKTLMEKSNYIDDLNDKSLLISNTDKRDEKLGKIEKESSLIDEAKEIFTAQAYHFFKENYSQNDLNISEDEKIYLTHYMIENDVVLDTNEFSNIINKKVDEENENSLRTLLNNKDISHENIEKEKTFFLNKLDIILKENETSFDDIENTNADDYKDNDFDKVLYYSSRLEKLAIADNILEQYYDNKITNLFGDNEEEIETFKDVTSLEEKKDIIDFIDFYGEDKTLYVIETGNYNLRFNEDERNELISQTMFVTEKLNSKFPTDRDTFITNSITSDMKEKHDVDITNSNDIKFIFKEALLNGDNNIDKTLDSYEFKAEKFNYQYNPVNFSEIHKGVNAIVYSMNEIFKERMTKYQNKQYKSKNHSKERMTTKSRNRQRGNGLT